MKKFYFALQFLTIGVTLSAQTPLAQLTIDPPSMVCTPGQCTQLTAQYTPLKATTEYTVQSIPYAPTFPSYGGTTIPPNGDDYWSPEFALPFTFNFYGNCYNSVLIGTNGVITFDLVNNSPMQFCEWQFNQTIPNPTFPIRNAIYGVYQDNNIQSPPVTNPSFQNINYYVLDTGINAAPNRVFVVNYNQLPMFQCNSDVGLQTSQIVIHEGTNIIEVLVKSRTTCSTWNAGSGLIGLQNESGTAAIAPPGRNTAAWNTTNEAWRFTPAGADLPPTFQWFIDGVLVPGETSNSMVVCPVANSVYELQMQVYGCNTPTLLHSNPITDILLPDPGLGTPVDITVCTQSPFVYTADLTYNGSLVLGALPAADYVLRYYDNQQDALDTTNNFISNPVTYSFMQDKEIFMSIESMNFGCIYVKPFWLRVNPPVAPPTGNANQDFTQGQTLADLHVTGTDLIWYDSPFGGNVLPSSTLLQDDTTYYASQIVNGCESNRGISPTRLAVTVNLVNLANETFNAGAFSVYPNPVTDKLTVKAKENIKSISVYDIVGKEILQMHPNQHESQINMASFTSGVYFLKLEGEKESRSIKILKN